jgi:hypothetical protein
VTHVLYLETKLHGRWSNGACVTLVDSLCGSELTEALAKLEAKAARLDKGSGRTKPWRVITYHDQTGLPVVLWQNPMAKHLETTT